MLRRETKYKPVLQKAYKPELQKAVAPVRRRVEDVPAYDGGIPLATGMLDIDELLKGIRAANYERAGGVVSVPYDCGLGVTRDMAAGDMSWVGRFGASDSDVKAVQDKSRDMSWVRAGAVYTAQENAPQPLDPPVRITGVGRSRRVRADNSRDYWIFRGEVYSTERGVCSAEDVKALALEGENKTKAKLARAHALMAQVDVLERGGRQPIPDDVKMFVWQRDGGKCVRCGSNRNLEFDHIIPVVMGGANTARNLQLLCEGCNRAKSASLV